MVNGENERLAVVETEVKNVKDIVNKIDKKLDDFTVNFASRDDLKEVNDRLMKLENRSGLKTTAMWVGLSASVIINIVMVYQLFRG